VHAEFATVDRTVDLLKYVAEDISLDFEQWDNRYARGPSLYFLVLSEVRFDSFADGLGTNRWPVENARVLPEDITAAVRVASDVAFDCDGAIVVAADGTFQERMVRVRSTPEHRIQDVEYPDWMSAKHLSAFEASTREGVLAAVTLSEEDGRVTVFRDGSYEDHERDELGGRWRADRERSVNTAPTGGGDESRE
jgi:diadenylate cyclase